MTEHKFDLTKVSLDDKYTLQSGRVFVTGTQALVRLPMMQRQRDLANGLNTACFISGYRGSPLGLFDQTLWRAKGLLKQSHIHFQPGVNEELAATAVWGSQQVNMFPDAKYDGVFSMWYGKGPGVDRAIDAIRHANAAGSAQHGGVLLLIGDDHAAASSTIPHQNEHNMMSVMMPMLNPSNVQEYLDFGLYGWAMSRFSGCWTAFKCQTETVESSASVWVDPHRVQIILPEIERPPGGLNIRWPDGVLEAEERLQRYKVYAALEFARANRLDRIVIDSPRPRLGIISTGKSYLDVRQALDDLGIDDQLAAEIGIRLYKVGLVWPLEREGARHFAEGLEEVVVVEEKRAFIENQLKEQLYNWREDVRPRVVGKFDENRQWLMPANGELTPAMIARVLAARISKFYNSPKIAERLDLIEAKERSLTTTAVAVPRQPWFCSGCPHNTSTKVPEGSRAVAGIGCHFMAVWMDRSTATFTQMGGEGASWIGQAPFTETPHIFANLGDGTYYHSGILAVRAAVASGANITYKILYNDAVAMTGGQHHDGPLSPRDIAWQVHAEGVKKLVVVTDEPDKYPMGYDWPSGTTVHHRDELDRIQRDFRELGGTTVIVYDQTCAAEKRRRRKRGTFPDPDQRVFINDLVCEGCGDCGVASNCVSVEPLETEFGRKRRINQSACNKDFSCLNGFCPSFVTVHGGKPKRAKAAAAKAEDPGANLSAPTLPGLGEPYNVLITGIGGTGVVTVGAILGMAAHLEGKGVTVLDQTGLAQKNGAVISHLRIAERPEDIHAVRIATSDCNLLLGCDLLVSGSNEALNRLRPGMTHAVVNGHLAPTAQFTRQPNMDFHARDTMRAIRESAGDNLTEFLDATRIATALMGDAIAANMFMLGHAFQRGLVPVSAYAIDRAIELNGAAVAANRRAFAWGRLHAVDPAKVEAAAKPALPPSEQPRTETLEEMVERRARFLTDYQDQAYSQRYRDLVAKAERAERDKAPGRQGFAEAVARYGFKLMAYKDEYEVARLYTDGTFKQKIAQAFDGNYTIAYHLAPPSFTPNDLVTGKPKKRRFGPWIEMGFRVLASLKGLRGSALDPFARLPERKMERQLIVDYVATIGELCDKLTDAKHSLAIAIATVPDEIRGYGHVKDGNLAKAKAREADLIASFRADRPTAQAAE